MTYSCSVFRSLWSAFQHLKHRDSPSCIFMFMSCLSFASVLFCYFFVLYLLVLSCQKVSILIFTQIPTSYIHMFFVKCHIFEGDEITNRMQIAWSVEYQFWFRGKILDDLHRKFNCEVEYTLYRLLLLRIRNMHIPLFLSDGVLNFFNDFSEGKTLYNYLPLSSLLHSWS